MSTNEDVKAGNAIQWYTMKQLADRIDAIYNSDTAWGETSSACGGRGPSCYATKTSSSYTPDGVPSLTADITAPFKATKFGEEINLYQRFEFVYFSTLGTSDLTTTVDPEEDNVTYACDQHSNDELPLVFSYPKYRAGEAYPILVSQFLVKVPEDRNSGNYYGTTACAEALGTDAGNVGNLIESHLDKINEWWPECNHKRRSEPTISAELYFISTPAYEKPDAADAATSWAGRCPCGGVFRVAFASTAAPAHNGDAKTLCGSTMVDGNAHSWQVTVPEDFTTVGAGITADCLTLTQSDWGQLLPYSTDTPETVKLYQVPPSNCCPRVKFPKFGYQGGGCDHNMFARGILLPNVSGSNGASYKEVWRGSYTEYTQKSFTGELKHIYPNEVTKYDNPDYSSYSEWKNACGDGTGSAYVRTTRMVFFYTDNEDEYYENLEANKDKIKAVVVEVPTSITVTIPGKFQPAIRKRWYDMLYHHIRLLSGYVIEKANAVYPIGASWGSAVEYPCANSALFDTMAAFLLTQDVGYPYYDKDNGTEYSQTDNSANLKADCEEPATGAMSQTWCVPFAVDCPNITSASCNDNTGLTTYQASTAEYSGIWTPPEYFFGEPYMEQVLCRYNVEGTTIKDAAITCTGKGKGQWNTEIGCFCTERIEPPNNTEESSNAPSEETSECSPSEEYSNEPYENPNPDSCAQVESSFPEFSGASEQESTYEDSCSAVVCGLNVPLPWDGGCGVDTCDCLTCGPGYKVYAASTNYLRKMISLLEDSKLSETSVAQAADRWRVICRTGVEDTNKDVVAYSLYAPDPYTMVSRVSCCDYTLAGATYRPTKLVEEHSCADYVKYAADNASACGSGVAVEGKSDHIIVNPRVERSPIQLLAWCPYIVPIGKDLKVRISISKEDMRKLLASYFVQGRGITNDPDNSCDYLCAISPVCGYINGSVYIGPYLSDVTPSMINPTAANFTMLPYTPDEYTEGIDTSNSWVGKGTKVKLLEGCAGGWNPGDSTINDTLSDGKEYYCEVPLEVASNSACMPGHYRKVIVINLTIDHDGFGMHGGGPTSVYTPPSVCGDSASDIKIDIYEPTKTQAIMCQLTPDITEVTGASEESTDTAKIQITKNSIPKYKTGSATINISITEAANT